jgi:hypothetical protein
MKELSDLTTPNDIAPRRILEKDVQKQCVDWARARGYWARKFSSQSQRSVPDYLFADGGLRIKFAVEFKAPGKKSTEAQVEEQQRMQAAGWVVFECDDTYNFQQAVQTLERDIGWPRRA